MLSIVFKKVKRMNVTPVASLSSLMGKLNRTRSLLISIVLQRILSIGLIRYEKKKLHYIQYFFSMVFFFAPLVVGETISLSTRKLVTSVSLKEIVPRY